MRFFNKFIFICNICFLAAGILRLVEINRKSQGVTGSVVPLPALEGSIVVLGYLAIIFNVIFCVALLLRIVAGKGWVTPTWMSVFNAIMLPLQLWYFFYSKF
jgi:hypothetical protein